MRNHNDKTRDMARSILAYTARKRARLRRAQIHGRERARLRGELHAMGTLADPDDFEGDLIWEARWDMKRMIEERRDGDKVGPLLSWAQCTVERDPVLSTAEPAHRKAHFRTMLPAGLIGEHALSHLYWVLKGEDPGARWLTGRSDYRTNWTAEIAMVNNIIAAGCHGDLNRRLRAELDRPVSRSVHFPAERVIDDQPPAPGLLLPSRTVTVRQRGYIRFLAGAHDAEAFVKDAGWDVMRVVQAFHREL